MARFIQMKNNNKVTQAAHTHTHTKYYEVLCKNIIKNMKQKKNNSSEWQLQTIDN